MWRTLKFPAKTAALYITAGTGTATGLAFHVSNPDSLSLLHDPFLGSSNLPEKIRTVYHGVGRSSRAIYTIGRTVVDYKYSLYGLPVGSEEYLGKLSEVHLRSAKRIRKLCEENKGFYVKAGQFVSAVRQVPKEYSSTLSSLNDAAVPCHFKAIEQVLISNLGQDLSEIFLSFDEKPIAAASIAQVHRGITKDHREVAVKVQYPGLADQMKLDTATMSFLSKYVSRLFPDFRFEWLVKEFEEAISLELDFIQEAKNSERTATNFKDNDTLKVPKIFWDLTTSQVLTMEFCSGHKLRMEMAGLGIVIEKLEAESKQINKVKKKYATHQIPIWVDDVEFLKEKKIDPKKVAKELMEVFAEMIFIHGFVHGDPHPGNILVSPGGRNGFSLVLLDHGIYKQLDEQFRLDYCELWKALIQLDQNKIQEVCERFGVGKYARYFPLIFTGRTIDSKSALGSDMSGEEKKNLKQELKSLQMEEISSFMESLPADIFRIIRTDGLLRSIIRKLGASRRVRLLPYAKCALYGLSTGSNPQSDSTVKVLLSRFKTRVCYFRLKLVLDVMELVSWMDKIRRFLWTLPKRFFARSNFSLPAATLKGA